MPIRHKKLIRLGTRIRVLVVDDSVVIRRLVTHALTGDPALEVVGSASNGSIGLARIPQLNPDVITLDIEMPEMDGLEMLRSVRQRYPEVRVIMFSTLTERGAEFTMRALALGADDYVTKAANAGSLDRSMASLRSDLIPRIKQFFTFEGAQITPAPDRSPGKTFTGTANLRLPGTPKIVAIGVSTGGPVALGTLIPAFPANFPLPIVIVQHMPPLFTRLLAERLNATSNLRVAEAAEGSVVELGRALIAPGNYHMRVRKNGTGAAVTLNQDPQENSCRPAVDVLFRSVEEVYGPAVISVVLTGMGYDGMRGAQGLKARGATVIAQNEESSVVWGMPGAVVNAGIADAVLPLEGIVPEILRRTGIR